MASLYNLNNSVQSKTEQVSSTPDSLRDAFSVWLEKGNAKKFPPQVAIECLDKISEYIISRNISCSIWDINKLSVYKPVYQKIMNEKLLRVMQKDTYKVFTVVGQFYTKFLKEKPWEKLIENPVITVGDEIIEGRVSFMSSDKETELTISRTRPDIKDGEVVAWLVTQPNANGTLYLDKVIRSYMSALRNAPKKLILDESVNRNVFACDTVEELDKLLQIFKAAPNYFEVNRSPWHGQFSAGLAAYRRYIEYLDKTTRGSEGKTLDKLQNDTLWFVRQSVRDAFRLWLIKNNPEWSSGTVTTHCSDAYYLFNNERGITLEEALMAEDGLQRAYDAIERHFINNPTQINNPSGSARGYLRSLRMLKEFLDEKFPELFNKDSITAASATIIPDSLIEVLAQNYASGFRFDTTALLLLGVASGVEIDENIKTALKRKMFCRDDEIYFLLDTVADVSTRNNIVQFADAYLQKYGCFEILEFYKLYKDRVNPKCIRSADDFESFYEQIGKSGVRCVAAPQIGNRIARFSNGNVWGTLKEVSAKIVAVITNEFYGSINEDDLHSKFCAFSTDLLAKIIKNCAVDDLVRVEINDNICYQTFDALGLPEDFSGVLSEALGKIEEIGLEPSQDVLHTAISLKMGVNFLSEFNLPDWDTFRRLIALFYKDEPRREWRRNIFVEVTD